MTALLPERMTALAGLAVVLLPGSAAFLAGLTPVRHSKMLQCSNFVKIPKLARPIRASPSDDVDEDDEEEPMSDDAFMSLIQFETRCGRFDRAQDSWQQYIEQKPSASTYVKYAQWAEKEANNLPLASQVYSKMAETLSAEEMQQQWVQLEYSGFQQRMNQIGQQNQQQIQQQMQQQMQMQQAQQTQLMQMAQGPQFGAVPVMNTGMAQSNQFGGVPNSMTPGAPFAQKKRYVMKPPFGPPQRWLEQQFEAEEFEDELIESSRFAIEPMGPVFGENPYQPPNLSGSRSTPPYGQAAGLGAMGMPMGNAPGMMGVNPMNVGMTGMMQPQMGMPQMGQAMGNNLQGMIGNSMPGNLGNSMGGTGMGNSMGGTAMGNSMGGTAMGGSPQFGAMGGQNMMGSPGVGFGEAMSSSPNDSGKGTYKVDADDPNWSKAEFGSESTYKPMSKQFDGNDFAYSDNFERPMVTDEVSQASSVSSSQSNSQSTPDATAAATSPTPSSWASSDATMSSSTMSSPMGEVGHTNSPRRMGETGGTASSGGIGLEPAWVSRGSLFQSEIESRRKGPKTETTTTGNKKSDSEMISASNYGEASSATPINEQIKTLDNSPNSIPNGAEKTVNSKEPNEKADDDDEKTRVRLLSEIEQLNDEIETMRKDLADAFSSLTEKNTELQAMDRAKAKSEKSKSSQKTPSSRAKRSEKNAKTKRSQKAKKQETT